jgi:hypothetical protein
VKPVRWRFGADDYEKADVDGVRLVLNRLIGRVEISGHAPGRYADGESFVVLSIPSPSKEQIDAAAYTLADLMHTLQEVG